MAHTVWVGRDPGSSFGVEADWTWQLQHDMTFLLTASASVPAVRECLTVRTRASACASVLSSRISGGGGGGGHQLHRTIVRDKAALLD